MFIILEIFIHKAAFWENVSQSFQTSKNISSIHFNNLLGMKTKRNEKKKKKKKFENWGISLGGYHLTIHSFAFIT